MHRMRISISVICLLSIFVADIAAGASRNSQAAHSKNISALNPPYRNIILSTDQFETTIRNDGVMGSVGVDPQCGPLGCPPFISPPGSGLNYLFIGAVWVGGIVGSDTLVTVAFDGWSGASETIPVANSIERNELGDPMVWTLFADTFINTDGDYDPLDHRFHKPLHLLVADRVYSRNSGGCQFEVIHDMVITNIGTSSIHDGYFGYFLDGDVYPASIGEQAGCQDDLAGSLPDQQIGYIIDNDGDPNPLAVYDTTSPTRAMALKILNTSFQSQQSGFNWWVSNSDVYQDFGPQRVDWLGQPRCNYGANLGTPNGDRYKYCMLSSGEWDYDQIFATDSNPGWLPPQSALDSNLVLGGDTRFLMSAGPFDLQPDSSVRIQFTVFTADSIHVDPTNFKTNIIDHKNQFLTNLGLHHLADNASHAEAWAQSLLDPLEAPTGFRISLNTKDSTVLGWDPWVFPDVIGYNFYQYEVPESALPRPGVFPPWITPPQANLAAQVGPTHQLIMSAVKPGHFYIVNVASRTAGNVGALSGQLAVQPGGRLPAPTADSTLLFVHPGESATIKWIAPPIAGIDHYNIYRFQDSAQAQSRYYPFYDSGAYKITAAPQDSFLIGGQWYFYYAMAVHATVPAGTTSFSEEAPDSTVYVVSAVDSEGYESQFSPEFTVVATPERTRDILLVTCRSSQPSTTRVACDTIFSYYQAALSGRDWDFYNYDDTTSSGTACKIDWWRDLLPYRLVILDGGLKYDIPNDYACETMTGLQKYLLSGGRLAYFGSFLGLRYQSENSGPTHTRLIYPFERDNFGVDTVFSIGIGWYFNSQSPGSPFPDTLGGFVRAEHVFGNVPDAAYDTLRNPFGIFSQLFNITTAPGTAAFKVNNHGQVIQRFRSRYPASTLVEGEPVGVRTDLGGAANYVFGYHLWYMKEADSRALVDYMLADNPSDVHSGPGAVLPDKFELRQNFPNPFNPVTRIRFALPKTAAVKLEIYNILGQKIRTLVDRVLPAGMQAVDWNGVDDNSCAVASGIYLYRIRTDGFVATRKMILLK